MTSISIECGALARALGNALAFMPARNKIGHVYLAITPDGVSVAGCRDGYVAGVDFAPGTDFQGPLGPEGGYMLTRETAERLLAAMKAGKRSAALLSETFLDGDPNRGALELDLSDSEPEAFPIEEDDAAAVRDAGLYAELFEILTDAEKRQNAIPGVLMVDPALFTPFSKVKADTTDRKADLLIKDAHSPILVKVGPTFRGLVMPVHRKVNAKKAGEDGLW